MGERPVCLIVSFREVILRSFLIELPVLPHTFAMARRSRRSITGKKMHLSLLEVCCNVQSCLRSRTTTAENKIAGTLPVPFHWRTKKRDVPQPYSPVSLITL